MVFARLRISHPYPEQPLINPDTQARIDTRLINFIVIFLILFLLDSLSLCSQKELGFYIQD